MTTSANLELVRSIFAAWERGEWASAEWADSEIDYVIAGGPQPGSWKGIAELTQAFRDFLGGLEGYRLEAEEYRELDRERVLVLVQNQGRGRISGVDLGQVARGGAASFTIRRGKVARLVFYWERDRALADIDLEQALSQRAMEIVLADLDNVNRRDWAAALAAYDEDVVLFVSASSGPDVGVFRGREAVGKWFGDWFRVFGTGYRFEVEQMRGVGDRVFVALSHHGHGRASGAEVEQITGTVFTVRAAKIVRVELYDSPAEALKAVGLE